MDSKFIKFYSHITEKSSNCLEENKFTFIINSKINKIELSKFLEMRFKIKIKKVNISTIHPKKVKKGKVSGKTVKKRKAVVTVTNDSKVESIKSLF